MNPEDSSSLDPPRPEPAPLQESMRSRSGYLHRQYRFLETLVALTISALILMSLGLNLFLFKQMRLMRGQLVNQRQVSKAVLDEFHNKREAAIHNFVLKLNGYASNNPDFRPILEKYRPYLTKYFPTGAPQSQTPPGNPQ